MRLGRFKARKKDKMNIYQRIVLILGAFLLVLTVWTSQTIDLFMAIREISILGATSIIFYAFKDIKKGTTVIISEGQVIIDKEALSKLMEAASRTKIELLEALEREKIRDKYLDKLGQK
jgi:hypothetical protein